MLTYFAYLIIVASFWASGTRMVGVFVVASLFGGSAAASLAGLGGAPLTPAVFSLPFLAYQALRTARWKGISAELTASASPWLIALVVWGIFSAVVLPRYFNGEILVNTTDRNSFSGAVFKTYLRPNSTNLTQTCYAIGGAAAFVLIRALLRFDVRLDLFRHAVLLLAALNVLAAIINVLERVASFPSVLEYVRNAQYAVIDNDVVGGLIRLQGTFPESSSFSAFTLALFAFTWSLARSGIDRRVAGGLAAFSLGLLLFSTSSTAYAALVIYLGAMSIGVLAQTLWLGKPPMLTLTAGLIWASLVAACCVVLLKPEFVATLGEFLQVTMLRKMESSSGVERNMWNVEAWGNFIDTYGLGTGLGSSRASGFPLVLLSNVGVVGTLLFAAFLCKVLIRPPGPPATDAERVSLASAHAVFVLLIAASLSQTMFDLGMAFYAFAAAATTGAANSVPHLLGASRHADAAV